MPLGVVAELSSVDCILALLETGCSLCTGVLDMAGLFCMLT